MTTTYQLNDTTLGLDASYDLHVAGHPNHDEAQEDFEAAYSQCAAAIGEQLGIKIDVQDTRYEGGPDAIPCEEANSWAKDFELWQAVHNCLYLEDGEWLYSTAKAAEVAKAIRKHYAA